MGSNKLTLSQIIIAVIAIVDYSLIINTTGVIAMVQYATYETKHAALATDFGYEFACKLFGKETVDLMPRYVRGKNAGKLKGFVGWRNCSVGGWSKAIGGVVYPGKCVRAWLTEAYYGDELSAVSLPWCGRVEIINFDRCYLYEKGREARIEESRRYKQGRIEELQEQIADYWQKIMLVNWTIAHVVYNHPGEHSQAIEVLAADRAKHEHSIACLENTLHSYGVAA